MHYKTKNAVLSILVGAAVITSTYPAHSKALTMTEAYHATQSAIGQIASGTGSAFTVDATEEVSVSEPDALDLWLEKLAEKESHGQDHIKILDVNNKYSYGCLQFQEGTFRNFGVKYGLVKPGAKLEPLIYNCSLQKQIAKHMIEDQYSMWQSWYTSVVVRNLGLPPTI